MIPGFEAKLSQVDRKRSREWNNYHKVQKEITNLSSDAKDLDDFLDFIGLETGKRNVLAQEIDSRKQKRDNGHPIQGTEVIDNAISAAQKKMEVSDKWFSGLLSIMKNGKKASMHYDAAMALVAICELAMLRANTYETCKKYKSYLESAFFELLKQKDTDIFYAQWGVILYTRCFHLSVKDGMEEVCVRECKEAYDKFQKVQKSTTGMEEYDGYKPGAENWEVCLLIWSLQNQFPSAENVLSQVLNSTEGIQRPIIKKYRYEVLENAVQQLEREQKGLGKAEERIKEKADTFAGDIHIILGSFIDMAMNWEDCLLMN